MIEISNYGITLKSLTHDKIEMVRKWRNTSKISQYMEYREEITSEMQEKWFKRINSSGTDFYFLIVADGKDIGLINVKDVNLETKTGETGIFIWDDSYLNSDYAIRAILVIHDFSFEKLGLERLLGRTLVNNRRAKRLNSFIGYKILPNQEDVENQRCELSKEDYYAKTGNVKIMLNHI